MVMPRDSQCFDLIQRAGQRLAANYFAPPPNFTHQ
jgi:hypothetical protein